MAKKNDLKNSMSGGFSGGLDALIQSTSENKPEKPKKEKSVHCNFVMGETFHKRLKVIAVRKGVPLKEVLQDALSDYFAKNEDLLNI